MNKSMAALLRIALWSLHLTVGLIRPAGVDLLAWLAGRLRADERYRRDLPRRANVHLHVGAAFRLPAHGPTGSRLTSQEASNYMMARVAALLPPALRPSETEAETTADTPPAA